SVLIGGGAIMLTGIQPSAQRTNRHSSPLSQRDLEPRPMGLLPSGQGRDRIGSGQRLDRLGQAVLVGHPRPELVGVTGAELRWIGGREGIQACCGQLLLGPLEGGIVETPMPAHGAGDVDAPTGGPRVLLLSVPSIQWALLPARGTRPDRRHRISRSGVGHLAVSDRPQRSKLTDRITNITKCSVGIGGSEALPPRGYLGGVAVADHLLLDAGDVDRPVMQPR